MVFAHVARMPINVFFHSIPFFSIVCFVPITMLSETLPKKNAFKLLFCFSSFSWKFQRPNDDNKRFRTKKASEIGEKREKRRRRRRHYSFLPFCFDR